MSAPAALRRGRVAAEQLMVDACTVRRAGPAVTDPVTGVVTATWTTVYTGQCKVAESTGFGAGSALPEAGEHAYTVQRYVLHLPASVTAPVEGDVATITAAQLDASLVGREYRIVEEFAKSFATARRFEVEETTS